MVLSTTHALLVGKITVGVDGMDGFIKIGVRPTANPECEGWARLVPAVFFSLVIHSSFPKSVCSFVVKSDFLPYNPPSNSWAPIVEFPCKCACGPVLPLHSSGIQEGRAF